MSEHPEEREFWDRVAADWDIQVGDQGDANRRLNSDPTLWELLGDVRGRRVLDAGCGTGYLARQLRDAGAVVAGVDLSSRMIEIARAKSVDIDYHVDSCTALAALADGEFDLLVANYVLMDVADYAAALRAFHRVLRPGGAAVLVFSHPCFPQGRAEVEPATGTIRYRWRNNYFECSRETDPPWAHFKADFVWFHRPMSAYWQAFRAAGFAVEELREPRIAPERYHLAEGEDQLRNSRARAYSIAFRLRKPGNPG